MTWLSAIIMGLVQGIAEFLPISSSGHLAIAEHLLNMQGASEIPQFYDVLLHLGTLVAVFIAYWDEIYDMIVEFFAGRRRSRPPHGTPRVVPPGAAHDIARHRRHAAAFRHGAVPSFF